MLTIKTKKRRSGFTLTEIVVTVVIVSVMVSFALPRFTGTFERVRAAEGVQILTALLAAQKAYDAEDGSYTVNLADLDVTIDRAQYFNVGTIAVFDPGDPVANPIAAITRTGAYTLDINENGDIACSGGGAFTCAQAGF